MPRRPSLRALVGLAIALAAAACGTPSAPGAPPARPTAVEPGAGVPMEGVNPAPAVVSAAAGDGRVAFVALGNRLRVLTPPGPDGASGPAAPEAEIVPGADGGAVFASRLLAAGGRILALVSHGTFDGGEGTPRSILVVFDAQDPTASPRRLAELDLGIGDPSLYSPVDLEMMGDTLLVTANDGLLRRVDLRVPSAPTLLPAFSTGQDYVTSGWPPMLAVLGSRAFVSAEGGVTVVDFADSEAPKLGAMLLAPGLPGTAASTDPFGNALDVAAVGERLLVTDPDGSAWLADPTGRESAATVRLPVGGTPWVAEVSGSLATLVVDGPDGLSMSPDVVTVDLGDPDAPAVGPAVPLPIDASRYVLRLGGALWAPRADGSELLAVAPLG